MAGPQTPSEIAILINKVGGLNEREKFTNENQVEFDGLVGFIPQKAGILQRANGIFPLQTLAGKVILNIFQTLDDRQNVIVQTDQGVYLFSENELMGRASGSLTPITLNEEETMSKAILVHSLAANTAGGGYTPVNTWVQAPLNSILSQLNPDGTAAAFVTALAANQFTLAAGSYRFNGWSLMSNSAAGNRTLTRLYNVTAAAAAWVGLGNVNSPTMLVDTANGNTFMPFGGDIVGLAVPTIFEIQGFMSAVQATNGFGFPRNLGQEIYRWLEIFKTA